MVLLGAVGVYVIKVVTGYIVVKTTGHQRQFAIDIIEASVNFVEQSTGESILSEEKFEIAKQRARESINKLGFKISDEELEMWIENFVKKLEEI